MIWVKCRCGAQLSTRRHAIVILCSPRSSRPSTLRMVAIMRVAWLQIFRARRLRSNEQSPKFAVQAAVEERRRIIGGGPAARSRSAYPSTARRPAQCWRTSTIPKSFRHGLNTRLAVVSCWRSSVVDAKAAGRDCREAKFVRLEHGQPRPERAKAAVALALEELHLWKLHVAGTDVIGDAVQQNIVVQGLGRDCDR